MCSNVYSLIDLLLDSVLYSIDFLVSPLASTTVWFIVVFKSSKQYNSSNFLSFFKITWAIYVLLHFHINLWIRLSFFTRKKCPADWDGLEFIDNFGKDMHLNNTECSTFPPIPHYFLNRVLAFFPVWIIMTNPAINILT